jgi:hypothetical protein
MPSPARSNRPVSKAPNTMLYTVKPLKSPNTKPPKPPNTKPLYRVKSPKPPSAAPTTANRAAAATKIQRAWRKRAPHNAYRYYTGPGSRHIEIAYGTRPRGGNARFTPKELERLRRKQEVLERYAHRFPRTVPRLFRGMQSTNVRTRNILTGFNSKSKSAHVPTFLSFSTNLQIAESFSKTSTRKLRKSSRHGYILIVEKGTYPSLRPGGKGGLKSNFAHEKEVTLPPGTYKKIRSTPNGIYIVASFTPNKKV